MEEKRKFDYYAYYPDVPAPVVPLGTLAAPLGWWMGGWHMERRRGVVHFPRNQVSPVEFLINRYAESHSVI